MCTFYVWIASLGIALSLVVEVSALAQRVGPCDTLGCCSQHIAAVQAQVDDGALAGADVSDSACYASYCSDADIDCDFDCSSDERPNYSVADCCYNTSPWGYGNPSDPSWWYHGMLLPNCPTLFPQFMADPRAVNMSAGWRFNDNVFEKNMIDVSYGAPVPIWRWFNVICYGDAMQFDLEGALWAIFDPLHESSPLVNADYYIGFPLTWKCGSWSWRLRGYHISSHIGDEFLLNHPTFIRENPSAQYLDFFLSKQLTEEIRIFAGFGHLCQVDPTFPVKRNYIDWGAETYFPYFNWDGWQYCILGRPFFGMYFRYWDENNWDQDSTYVLGYELMKLTGMQGKLRAFLEYHNGFSWEGQFCQLGTDYFALRISYGY